MTGQEARDDERAIFEALADRLGEHPHSRNHEQGMSGEYETFIHETNVEALAEWLMPTVLEAVARKHPEPEIEYGRLTIYGGQVMSELAVGDREEAERMVVDGRRSEATEREDVQFQYELARRTKAVPAGPWLPVGEGEQPAPKATLVDERDPACVAAWPGCGSGEYDPRCCRFPKSCSAGIIRLVTPGEGEQ